MMMLPKVTTTMVQPVVEPRWGCGGPHLKKKNFSLACVRALFLIIFKK